MSLIESDIAADLNALLVEFAELMLGSYPRTSNDVDYMTMLTLESRDESYAERSRAIAREAHAERNRPARGVA